MHRQLYLRDRDKYGDAQEWTMLIGNREVKCYTKRTELTNVWCGYVELNGHKIENWDVVHVHGGITFHSETALGFDCCHTGDWWPGPDDAPPILVQTRPKFHATDKYWTFPDVKAETEKLAQKIYA